MSEKRQPMDVAIEAIRRRERTVAEIDDWLQKWSFSGEERAEVIEELLAIGELDDERFARRFAEDKRELSGWGPDRIREVLAGRGIAPDIAERAAAEPGGDAADRATELLLKRKKPLGTDRERSRALSFLARRGFDYETAYEAVRRAQQPDLD